MKIDYRYLENEEFARKYLTQKYQLLETKKLVYQNVHAFTSYIKQGTALLQAANENNFWSKPLLLYYGMMSLLKAFAITVDSQYPQSTSVLQHGLASPKRKKESYRFFMDEVRVKKDGFFPYICNLLRYPIITGERYKMEFLCSFLPDLQFTLAHFTKKRNQWPIKIQTGNKQNWQVSISTEILSHLCLSTASFVNRLNIYKAFHFEIGEESKSFLTLCSEQAPQKHPWIYQQENGDYSLWIGDSRLIKPLPEILAHFALLFSLSMLCRYHPPLWRELNNDTEQEQLLIHELMSIVQRKFPKLILRLLQTE